MSRKRKPQRSNARPLILISVGLALVAGAFLWSLKPAGEPALTQPSPHAQEDTFPEIARVGLEEAKAAFDAGSAVFLDVRDPSAYTASRIPGALSIPLAELDERLNKLEDSDWIITYCT